MTHDEIKSLNPNDFPRNRHLRRQIKLYQSGAKFYQREIAEIERLVRREKAAEKYYNEDGPIYNHTIVDALIDRDVNGTPVPEYIKNLPGCEKVGE